MTLLELQETMDAGKYHTLDNLPSNNSIEGYIDPSKPLKSEFKAAYSTHRFMIWMSQMPELEVK